MSKVRLKTIISYIEDIEYIVSNYNGVVSTLEDRIGKHSLLMCLMQIGENLNKLETNNAEIQKAAQGAYAVRISLIIGEVFLLILFKNILYA